MLAAEGAFALTLPLVIGPWSDTFHTLLGRRRPFMLVALGPMASRSALVAFMPNLWTTALLLFALFFAYYVYEPPYRGLYPDVLSDRVFGRAQGSSTSSAGSRSRRADRWRLSLPPLAACPVPGRRVSGPCRMPVPILLVTEDGGHGRVFEGVRSYVARSWRILRSNRDVATFLVANTAGGHLRRRSDVRRPLRHGRPGRAARHVHIILGAVAGGYIVAALVAGPIGDRVGLAHVITAASAVYGVGLLAGGLGPSGTLVPRADLRRRDRRRHR